MNIGTIIYTFLFCKYAGIDQYGNKYYTMKSPDENGKYRRSVIYKGMTEASKVPPHWHAWLRFSTNDIPPNTKKYSWQKEFKPNLTGTENKYLPKGHLARKDGKLDYTKPHYESWQS